MCHWFDTCDRIAPHPRKSTVGSNQRTTLNQMIIFQRRWLIDNGRELDGLQVIADLHGGDSDDPIAMAVYQEIKDKVREDVCIFHLSESMTPFDNYLQRESGEARSYRQMWYKYKRRVLLAMSSQAFAQLASNIFLVSLLRVADWKRYT